MGGGGRKEEDGKELGRGEVEERWEERGVAGSGGDGGDERVTGAGEMEIGRGIIRTHKNTYIHTGTSIVNTNITNKVHPATMRSITNR